ncbi:hypothetical protein DUI87_00548 [Hirundo rustica rustica]|uniref:Uncharacterized protein n=1 Tax=Hirundo rustica rustica TaxID=333673 RepID=A0A3M0LTA1_HIRRU|nr:hypothetical protein DUI87_00548 [Hirundo rustica rustica]
MVLMGPCPRNVQGLLNVKDTTFLVFHLVTFLYMVYSFSRMSHTLLNTVGQQIEAGEQGDKSVTQAAANPTAIQAAAKPDSEAKTPAVAAVKKRKKHTDKTDRPVDDDQVKDPQCLLTPSQESNPLTHNQKLKQLMIHSQKPNQLIQNWKPNQLLPDQEPDQLLQDQEPDKLLQEQEILLSPFP